MKDRTIDYSRQDAGETMKDIKTKSTSPSVHSRYEKHENYKVEELASKVARLLKRAQAAVPPVKDTEDTGAEPTPEEYVRRQERMRNLLGMIIGGGYGTIAGGIAGGELFGHGPGFDRATALKSALVGLLTGGSLGYGAGAAFNKLKRYTGESKPAAQPSTIQIVLSPSSHIVRNVEDAMKSGSATARTVAIFTGIGACAS